MSVRSALEELDLSAVLACYLEQSEKHGHTADTDAELPLAYFRADLLSRAQSLEIMLPGARQRLDVGYQRCAVIAAMALATMRRIRREQLARDAEPDPVERCRHLATFRIQACREFPLGATRCHDCKQVLDELEARRDRL